MNIRKDGSKIMLTWNIKDPEDVEKARDFFVTLTREGWFATKRNSKLQRVLEFNPEHRELWLIPLSEGG